MKAVIMAGGKGTRIASLAPDIPKPMIPVCGKPVLEWEIENLRKQGFTDLILTVSYRKEAIEEYFGDGSRYGVHIEYFEENVPLGNAGALFRLGLTEDFLLLNADAVFDVDFARFVRFHKEKGGLVSLFSHPNSHPYDSGLLITDGEGRVERWLTKEEERPEYYRNLVNAGLHVLSPEVMELALKRNGLDRNLVREDDERLKRGESVRRWDLDRDLLKPLCGMGGIYAYVSPEYVKDMGTPDRFAAVCRDFANGTVAARNLSNPQKCVFLDRDGVLSREVGFCSRTEDFELLPWAAANIRKINESGYLAVVVTNQPVIARGETTFEELDRMHRKLETELGREGAWLDGIYFCPHHPDSGFPGEVKKLKIVCSCRKPKPGMLLKAAEDLNIDLGNSFMIGDSARDIQAGDAAGCKKSILVSSNEVWDVSLLTPIMNLVK